MISNIKQRRDRSWDAFDQSVANGGWARKIVRWVIVPLWLICFAAAVWNIVATLATAEVAIGITIVAVIFMIIICNAVIDFNKSRRVAKAGE